MHDARTLWKSLLSLPEPWVATAVAVQPALRRVDVGIGLDEPRGWFGLGRKPARATETLSWRHLNYGDWVVQVTVAAPLGADLSRHAWAGERGQPFSRGLSEQIFALLRTGCGLQVVSEVLGVPVGEVWRFKYFLDNGRWTSAVADMPGVGSRGVPANEGLPAEDDPVWQEILEGRRTLDVRVLGLRMLLTKLRGQLDVINDDAVRTLKVQEFQRYFAKNQRLLSHEISQLRRAA